MTVQDTSSDPVYGRTRHEDRGSRFDFPFFAFESSVQLKSHNMFLAQVTRDELVGSEVTGAAKEAWWKIFAVTDGLMPYPAGCAGPEGDLLYYWDFNEHHLELEFALNRIPEFFYRNRLTNELWESVLDAESIPQDAVAKLKLFCNFSAVQNRT